MWPTPLAPFAMKVEFVERTLELNGYTFIVLFEIKDAKYSNFNQQLMQQEMFTELKFLEINSLLQNCVH